MAKLSQKKYEVLNEQLVVQNLNTQFKEIRDNQFSNVLLNNVLKNSNINLKAARPLAIPKRPKYKEGVSSAEFDRLEREAFLNWRRALAEEEEKNVTMVITPFEKNINVWRQLWLVVEKSDVLIQIVDGRNPLFFRNPDLETYIKEVNSNKTSLLLVNKADLMNEGVRKSWADYFIENNINYLFFSALEEAKKIEEVEENVNKVDNDVSDDEEAEVQNVFNKFKDLDVDSEDEEKEEIVKNDNKDEKKRI